MANQRAGWSRKLAPQTLAAAPLRSPSFKVFSYQRRAVSKVWKRPGSPFHEGTSVLKSLMSLLMRRTKGGLGSSRGMVAELRSSAAMFELSSPEKTPQALLPSTQSVCHSARSREVPPFGTQHSSAVHMQNLTVTHADSCQAVHGTADPRQARGCEPARM